MPNINLPIGFHKQLNPKLWDGEVLRPEVKKSLLRISREFYKFLKISSPVKDIYVTGSQANFNYSKKSDLDLHLVFDFNEISCDEPIEELFDTKRKLWREKHNIDIYDIPVEVYAEDLSKPSVSSAYSIISDTWIRDPSQPVISYNVDKVEHLTELWLKLIKAAIKSKNFKICDYVMKLLADYRKLGLEKHGEFGAPNLVYKSLRNMGAIERLSEYTIRLKDQSLGLD